MKTILSLILVLICSPAIADNYLVINAGAHHWNRDQVHSQDLNERNFGIGFEHGDADRILAIGYYRNSLDRISTYAIYGWTPLHAGPFKAGAIVGYVSGYPVAPIVPAVGLVIAAQYQKVGVNVLMVPSVDSLHVAGFAGFQLKYKF